MSGARPIQVLRELGGDDAFTYALARYDGRAWAVLRRARPDSVVARRVPFSEMARKLRHDHVASTLATGSEEDGSPYVLEEYTLGVTLAQILDERRAVPWSIGAATIRMLLLGLEHVLGCLDPRLGRLVTLEASQAILGFDGRCKVVDPMRYQRYVPHFSAAALYAAAPEVRESGGGDPAALVYACGVFLWELCAGRPHIREGSRAALDPLEGVVPGLPRRLDDVIRKATAPDPAARYPRPEAFATALVATTGAIRSDFGAYMQKTYGAVYADLKEQLLRAQKALSLPPPEPPPMVPPSPPVAAPVLRRSVIPAAPVAPAPVPAPVPPADDTVVTAPLFGDALDSLLGDVADVVEQVEARAPRIERESRPSSPLTSPDVPDGDPEADLFTTPFRRESRAASPVSAISAVSPVSPVSMGAPTPTPPETRTDDEAGEAAEDVMTRPFRRQDLALLLPRDQVPTPAAQPAALPIEAFNAGVSTVAALPAEAARASSSSSSAMDHVQNARDSAEALRGADTLKSEPQSGAPEHAPVTTVDPIASVSVAAVSLESAQPPSHIPEPTMRLPSLRADSREVATLAAASAPARTPTAPAAELDANGDVLRIEAEAHHPPASYKPPPAPEASVIVAEPPEPPRTERLAGGGSFAPPPPVDVPMSAAPHTPALAHALRASAPPPAQPSAQLPAQPSAQLPATPNAAIPSGAPPALAAPSAGGAGALVAAHASTPPPGAVRAVGAPRSQAADPTMQLRARRSVVRPLDVILLVATLLFVGFIAWMLWGPPARKTAQPSPPPPPVAATSAAVNVPAGSAAVAVVPPGAATLSAGPTAPPVASLGPDSVPSASVAPPGSSRRNVPSNPAVAPLPTASASVVPTAAATASASASAAATASAPVDDADQAFLTVVCVPACENVEDNGQSLGPSPVYKRPIKAGQHALRLRWADPPREKSTSVDAKAGQTASVRVTAE
jgi:hypothetical protein